MFIVYYYFDMTYISTCETWWKYRSVGSIVESNLWIFMVSILLMINNNNYEIAFFFRGHIDITILGAMQVSQFGDIANWMIPVSLINMYMTASTMWNLKKALTCNTFTIKHGLAGFAGCIFGHYSWLISCLSAGHQVYF